MKALVYINRRIMAVNKKMTKESGQLIDRPAISVRTYQGSIYCKEVEFTKGCKLIQNAEQARCSGATIWMQVDEFESLIIDGQAASQSMLENSKNLDLDAYFWQFVEDAAWRKNTNYRAIAARLSPEYGATREALQVMFRELQNDLIDSLNGYFNSGELGVSDDRLKDLTAHIIGMGKNKYYQVLDKPDRAIAYCNSFVESFAYVLLELRV